MKQHMPIFFSPRSLMNIDTLAGIEPENFFILLLGGDCQFDLSDRFQWREEEDEDKVDYRKDVTGEEEINSRVSGLSISWINKSSLLCIHNELTRGRRGKRFELLLLTPSIWARNMFGANEETNERIGPRRRRVDVTDQLIDLSGTRFVHAESELVVVIVHLSSSSDSSSRSSQSRQYASFLCRSVEPSSTCQCRVLESSVRTRTRRESKQTNH